MRIVPGIVLGLFVAGSALAGENEELMLKRQNAGLKWQLAEQQIQMLMKEKETISAEFKAAEDALLKAGYTKDPQGNLLPPNPPDPKPAKGQDKK